MLFQTVPTTDFRYVLFPVSCKVDPFERAPSPLHQMSLGERKVEPLLGQSGVRMHSREGVGGAGTCSLELRGSPVVVVMVAVAIRGSTGREREKKRRQREGERERERERGNKKKKKE